MALNPQTIAAVLAVLILTYKEIRERVLTKKYGLAVNPKRCAQHTDAINALRGQVSDLQDCTNKIAEKVGIVL